MRQIQVFEAALHMAADQATGNGAPAAKAVSQEDLKRIAAMSRDVSASFGQLVSLMMRMRQYKFTMLSELEWLLLPAIATRQFRVAEGVSQDKGLVAPIAAVLWAQVNPEVDRRIAESLDLPIRLKPEEWRSGENFWIIEALGDPKGVTAMLQHLKQNELKDKVVKMRVRSNDGKVTVGRLELQGEVAQPAA